MEHPLTRDMVPLLRVLTQVTELHHKAQTLAMVPLLRVWRLVMEHPLTQDMVPLLKVLTLGTELQQAVPILGTEHNQAVPILGTERLRAVPILGTEHLRAVQMLATEPPLRGLTQAMGLHHKVPTQGTGHLKKMQAHYTGHQPPPAIAHLIMMTMTTMVVSLAMAGKNKTVLQAL